MASVPGNADAENTLVVVPPLRPFEIAYRARAARRHLPTVHNKQRTCACGSPLPCPAATALLRDLAADLDRVQVERGRVRNAAPPRST
jgi:hypothetical protein